MFRSETRGPAKGNDSTGEHSRIHTENACAALMVPNVRLRRGGPTSPAKQQKTRQSRKGKRGHAKCWGYVCTKISDVSFSSLILKRGVPAKSDHRCTDRCLLTSFELTLRGDKSEIESRPCCRLTGFLVYVTNVSLGKARHTHTRVARYLPAVASVKALGEQPGLNPLLCFDEKISQRYSISNRLK